MWLIAESPITVRTGKGDVRLTPGVPQELSDPVGQRVLERAGQKVRIHEPTSQTVIGPASPTARPVYWESADGTLCGPATPEFLARSGPPGREQFWVVVTYESGVRWIDSKRLRAAPSSKKLMRP